MESTDPTMDLKNKSATDYAEEPSEITETVAATNDPPKVKPKKVNRRQLKKQPKIGRNAPCPCGSGKKYKKCHLAIQQEEMQKQLEIRRQVDEFTQKSSESKSEEAEVSQAGN